MLGIDLEQRQIHLRVRCDELRRHPLEIREPHLDLLCLIDDVLCRENISVGMDDESGTPTTLRLLGFDAGLGVTLGDDTDLDNGWTRVVGESDVSPAHNVELGLGLVLRGVTPDRRGWGYQFVGECSRLRHNKKSKTRKNSRQHPVHCRSPFPKAACPLSKRGNKDKSPSFMVSFAA